MINKIENAKHDTQYNNCKIYEEYSSGGIGKIGKCLGMNFRFMYKKALNMDKAIEIKHCKTIGI